MKDADIKRANELADRARHESVTPERLTQTELGLGRYRLHDDPVYRYLQQGEQPAFLFHGTNEPVFNGPGAPDGIERSHRHRVMHLVTDSRWLMIAGNDEGDKTQEFQLDATEATNYDTAGSGINPLTENFFVFELSSAHCTVPLADDYNEDDLEELSIYLRDNFGATRGGVPVDSDEAGYTIAGDDSISYDAADVRSRIDRLPDEARKDADTLVAEADSVEELIPQLDELLEEHQEETQTLNDVVSAAETVNDIRQGVETPQEQAARQAREAATKRIDTAREALQNAEPEAIGKWGANVGRASLPLAVAAPGSTPLWVAATLAAGGAAGVHSSGVEGSPLEDIDTEELSEHVLALAKTGRELDEIDAEVAGTLLGAFTYLGGRMAPEQFAKWIEAADPDAILAGADAGAAYANRNDVEGNRLHGAIAGGGLGILGSYAGYDFEAVGEGESDSATEIEQYLTQLQKSGMLEGSDPSE